MDYDRYIAVFNSGDDDVLVDTFFADDIVFTGGTREHRGKTSLREFLAWAHDGVREVMRPQAVCRDARRLFVEIDMDFNATKARDDFPFGALRPGDSITVKFFVTYDLDHAGRIRRLQSMTWPPGRGVSKLPRLGGHPSQLAAYRAYAAAFSAFSQVRETLTVHKLLADDGSLFIDSTSRFTAIADAPNFVVGALSVGESIEVRVFVYYTLRDGLICNIKVARAGTPVKLADR
jgi:hypothetical protein